MPPLALDAAWAVVIGALGRAFITGVVGIGSAMLTHRWQERSERQERAIQRRDAYVRYLAAVERLESEIVAAEPWDEATAKRFAASEPTEKQRLAMTRLRAWREAAPEAWDEAGAAQELVRLVAGEDLRRVFEAYLAIQTRKISAALTVEDPGLNTDALVTPELVDAMRAEVAEDTRF